VVTALLVARAWPRSYSHLVDTWVDSDCIHLHTLTANLVRRLPYIGGQLVACSN